ncbi:MAG TPA: DUF481 domain-containing protein [Acidobacteriaceae bacterium]|nr:DUF481 domain-containing protein [Acidobacteriaceae bacterium]
MKGHTLPRFPFWLSLALAAICAGSALPASAADTPSKPGPDVLTFSNGDRITGQFEKVDGGKIFFKTDAAGELQVPWDKIKGLQVKEPFAVIVKTDKIHRGHRNLQIPVGSVDATDKEVTVHTESGEQSIPVSSIVVLVDEKSYRNDVEHTPGILHGWTGAITGGASTVTSTQDSVSYNTGVAVARPIPSATWMNPSYRTLLGFTSSYGEITEPNFPTVKTNIFHAAGEQDKYFSPRLYILGQAIFDHNYSQGLDLQQVYGGGLGYTVIKQTKQELDVTGTMNYTKQEFQISSSNLNLVGSTIGDSYFYHFPRSIVLTEVASYTPEWNQVDAYSANAAVGLALPVLKKLAFSVQVIDSYLNNPPSGFQANSLQFNTGLTYTLP